MQLKQYTNPFYILFLVLPYGISVGFAMVTLPYVLTHNGFSVETTANIASLAVLPNVWRFVWGPAADVTLSLRRWYWIGVIACFTTLLLLCFIPHNTDQTTLLAIVVLASQIAATLVILPVGGIMANRIEESKKGRASGWYQVGNLGGMGLGGGAGLWLTTHYSIETAGIVLSVAMILVGSIIMAIKDVKTETRTTVARELKTMGKDLLAMVKVPVILYIIILLTFPIGPGSAGNLWSAIAKDWNVSADTVALITGALSGVVSSIGCIIGGIIADRKGVFFDYFFSGAVCATVTIAMAALPYETTVYIGGVLAYAFGLGLMNAAFTSIILYAIGTKGASTKYSLLSSFGNIPVLYMTAYDGWAHDHGGSKFMLCAEAAAGFIFIVLSLLVLTWMRKKKLVHKPGTESQVKMIVTENREVITE
jgi:MFS family permease